MRVDVVLTKSLHAEVVDKTILFYRFHVLTDLGIVDFRVDESKGDTEPVSLERTKLQRLEDALKAPNFDIWVPVFASLLANQLLCIHPVDRHFLSRNPSLVLVASDLELLRYLTKTLRNVVDCLH